MSKIKLLLTSVIMILVFTGFNNTAYAATYKYDNLNRLIEVIYASGQKVIYTYDGNGNILTVTKDQNDLTAPINLISSSVTNTGLTLSWTDSTDKVTITEYDIYSGTTKIGTTTGATTFDVTGLTPNTSYSFTVTAKDASGNESAPSTATEVTTIADTASPTAPTNVTLGSIASTSLTLNWIASTDNVGVAEYDIYNGTKKIGTTTGATTFDVTGLTPNTSYSFTVTAKDASGNESAASTAVAVSTTETDPVELSGTAFGTSPAFSSNSTYDKAFDGDTNTYFDYSSGSGGYTGIDLGVGNLGQITKISYYPRSGWAGRMVGGKFQGSITSSSSGYVDLYTIPSQPSAGWNQVTINNASKFRYIRYVSPSVGYANVAEIKV
ncbi:YD repeat-containing protein, partial [Clostridium acidisoli DSM 12555]